MKPLGLREHEGSDTLTEDLSQQILGIIPASGLREDYTMQHQVSGRVRAGEGSRTQFIPYEREPEPSGLYTLALRVGAVWKENVLRGGHNSQHPATSRLEAGRVFR